MFLCNFLLLTGCMLLYAFQSVFVAGVFLRRSFGLACLWVGLLSFLYVFWPTQLPNTNIDLAYPSRLRWLEAMRPLTFCNEPVDQLALMKYDIQNVHLIWINLDIKRAQKFFEQLLLPRAVHRNWIKNHSSCSNSFFACPHFVAIHFYFYFFAVFCLWCYFGIYSFVEFQFVPVKCKHKHMTTYVQNRCGFCKNSNINRVDEKQVRGSLQYYEAGTNWLYRTQIKKLCHEKKMTVQPQSTITFRWTHH